MTPPPCSRCQNNPSSVHFPSTPRCIPCFTHYLTRHFKTSLNRLPPPHRTHNVTIALSGGPCSSALALLHAHYISILKRPPTTPPPKIHLLHVIPEGQSVPSVLQTVRDVMARDADVDLVVERLSGDVWEGIENVRDGSDRGMLRRMEVWKAILRGVRRIGGEVVMLGTCVERAAADVLMAMATGRGGEVMEIVSGGGKCGLRVVRPVLDTEMRYLIRYARGMLGEGVGFVYREEDGVSGGIRGAVERFVGEVGEGNKGSVHNVVKTVGKLGRVEGGLECKGCGGKVGEGRVGLGREGELWEGGWLCGGCAGAVKRGGGGVESVVRLMTEVEMREQVSEFLL